VSPEKQTRFLPSANQPEQFHAFSNAIMSAIASTKARDSHSPLCSTFPVKRGVVNLVAEALLRPAIRPALLADARYDAVILSEGAALFPLVSVCADEPSRSRRIPLRRCNLVTPHAIACTARNLAKIQRFAHIAHHNHPRINTSKNSAIFCNSLIPKPFNPTRINTYGNKDLKSIRINTYGSKDLKSFRINTSKKHGRGVVSPVFGTNSILDSWRSRPKKGAKEND
jgi:hypothetical protein